MQEPHSEGVAHHTDPESCAGHRKVSGEALTGESADRVFSYEISSIGVPTLFTQAEGHTEDDGERESSEDPAQSETPCTRGRSSCGKREIPEAPAGDGRMGRSEESQRLHVRHARCREVGRSHSTEEVPEQRSWCANAGGGRGGKGTDQEEHTANDHVPDTEPGQRAERLAACAGSGTREEGRAVHRPFAPCQHGSTQGELLRTQS